LKPPLVSCTQLVPIKDCTQLAAARVALMRTEALAVAATFVRPSQPCLADSAVLLRELRNGTLEAGVNLESPALS